MPFVDTSNSDAVIACYCILAGFLRLSGTMISTEGIFGGLLGNIMNVVTVLNDEEGENPSSLSFYFQ
jgi:hypothetical protein